MAKKDNAALAWLVGLGTLTVAGIGIYFYEKSQPAAPTGGGTAVANVANQTATIAGQTMTYAQWANFAASIDHASLSDWQATGIPSALYSQMNPQLQSIMTALGYHVA